MRLLRANAAAGVKRSLGRQETLNMTTCTLSCLVYCHYLLIKKVRRFAPLCKTGGAELETNPWPFPSSAYNQYTISIRLK